MCIREFDIKRFFTLDDYYDSDRLAYYNALKKVSQEFFDLTEWLEYFTNEVLLSVLKVKKGFCDDHLKSKGKKEKDKLH